MATFKVEALRHLNETYTVEADSAEEAGDIVQAWVDGPPPLGDRRVSLDKAVTADAEVIWAGTATELAEKRRQEAEWAAEVM
jgi:hypothetical protein